jgi:hypothetical protein
MGAAKTMLEWTEERFGLKPERLAADTAYASAATLDWIVTEKGIAPHIPVWDRSKREDGTFSREDLTFDKQRNLYICPAGKTLTTTGTPAPTTRSATTHWLAIVEPARSSPNVAPAHADSRAAPACSPSC